VNVYAGGEAFERAREAMNHLKSKRSKAGALTSFVTGNETFDLIANTVYHLHDTLLESISIKQWQTIKIHMETNRQDLTAKKLGLNESTVSRNLRRGFWWQIHETRQAMERVIEVYFPGARQRCNFIGLHINMQPFMKLFLTVLLAHLMGDFPLQTASMVRAKQQGARAYIAHGAVHLLVFILCVAAFVRPRLLISDSFWIAAFVYVAAHLGIDRAKQRLISTARMADPASSWSAVTRKVLKSFARADQLTLGVPLRR